MIRKYDLILVLSIVITLSGIGYVIIICHKLDNRCDHQGGIGILLALLGFVIMLINYYIDHGRKNKIPPFDEELLIS